MPDKEATNVPKNTVPEGYGLDALIEAFTIFRKYANPQWPTNCRHDTLDVVDPAVVSTEDKIRLDALGFRPREEWECFISYRFGSA